MCRLDRTSRGREERRCCLATPPRLERFLAWNPRRYWDDESSEAEAAVTLSSVEAFFAMVPAAHVCPLADVLSGSYMVTDPSSFVLITSAQCAYGVVKFAFGPPARPPS